MSNVKPFENGSLQGQPGCRSMLVRLIFRPAIGWPVRRPLRLKVTFTMPAKAARNGDERNIL